MSFLSIGEAAGVLGVAVSTLRRWEFEGKLLPSHRTPSGHRRYAYAALRALLDPASVELLNRVTVCYARVSSHDQKADLERQAQRLQRWCATEGIESVEVISDLGSGLNYRKKGLRRLLRMIALGQLDRLVLTHKDRLLRFGYELLFELCRLNGIEVVVIDSQKRRPKQLSPALPSVYCTDDQCSPRAGRHLPATGQAQGHSVWPG